MTTICSFDCNQSALLPLVGDKMLYAPVDGDWMKVSPRVFEEQVRKLAYGLMVKDFRRGDTLFFNGCTEEMRTFIGTACSLAHLNASFSESADDIVMSVSEVGYLMSIGATWSLKYKSSVDRTITRLILGC